MTTEEQIRVLREALAKNPTTGPWFDSRSERFPECYVRAANGQHIAAVPWSTENDGANAALIAAAHPEAIRAVLAALEAAHRDAERYRFIRDADRSDCITPELGLYAMESLDEYVDAAMEDEKRNAALTGA